MIIEGGGALGAVFESPEVCLMIIFMKASILYILSIVNLSIYLSVPRHNRALGRR